ncbi:hypothetical protein ACEPAH_9076 [Sanghuangporus vaninii]
MDILGKGGTLDLSSLASQAMVIRRRFVHSASSTLVVLGLNARSLSVANLAIWLYEFSMTVDKEVRLVWPSRFTIIKLLFFANRYLPLFTISANAYFLILNDNEDEYLCKPALLFIGYMSFAGFFLAEAVLALRVYVIWQARKSIFVLVFGTLFAKTGTSCAITYFYLTSAEMSPINLFRSGCECIFTRRIEWITMLLVFLFEIVILSLMIIAKRVHFKRSRSELVDILLKDGEAFYYRCRAGSGLDTDRVNAGVLYCITIMAISLMNIFVVKFAPVRFHLSSTC